MVLKTYCLARRKHTANFGTKNVNMTNKVIRNKLMCSICLNDKSRFMKQKIIIIIINELCRPYLM